MLDRTGLRFLMVHMPVLMVLGINVVSALLLSSPRLAHAQGATISEVVPWTDPLCAYCKPGEYSVIVNDLVSPGHYAYTDNPSCMEPIDLLTELKRMASEANQLESGDFAGAAQNYLRSPAVKEVLSRYVHGDIGKLLQGEDTAVANCKPVCAVIPAGAVWTGAVKMGALNSNVSAPSPTFPEDKSEIPGDPARSGKSQDAISGYSRWTFPMQNGRAICAAFSSWDSSTKAVQLSITFRPPNGWTPKRVSGAIADSSQPRDQVPIAFDIRPSWDVGVTACGMSRAYEASVETILRKLNFTNLRPSEIYAKAYEASYGIANQFQVFYYSNSARDGAFALSDYLSQSLHVRFAVPAVGAGVGVNPVLRDRTLFVHAVSYKCREPLSKPSRVTKPGYGY